MGFPRLQAREDVKQIRNPSVRRGTDDHGPTERTLHGLSPATSIGRYPHGLPSSNSVGR